MANSATRCSEFKKTEKEQKVHNPEEILPKVTSDSQAKSQILKKF